MVAGLDDETVYKIMRGNAIRMLAPRPRQLAAVDPRGRRRGGPPLRAHRGVRRRRRHPAQLRGARRAIRRGRSRTTWPRAVGPGAVVGLTLPSTTAYVLAYVGAAKAGAITAGINPRLTRARAAGVPRHRRARPRDRDRRRGRAAARRRRRPWPPELPEDPDRPVVVVFTSGTTGLPKGAMFTNRQLAAVTRIDVGDAVGRRLDGADAGRHPVRPHRLHDQAAVVPAAGHRPPTCSTGGGPPTCSDWSPSERMTTRRRRRRRRSRCCCASPTSTSATCRRCSTHRRWAAGRRRPRWCARPAGGSAPPTRSATRRPSRAASAPAPRSTPTTTRRSTPSAGPRPASSVEIRDEDGACAARRRGRRGVPALPTRRCAATGATPRPRADACRDGWVRTGDLGSHRRARAACAWPAGPRRCSSGAATTCTRSRSRRCWPRTPPWPSVAVVPRPDAVMGEIGVAVVVAARPGRAARRSTTCAPSPASALVGLQAARGRASSSTRCPSRRCRRSTARPSPPCVTRN